MIHEILTTRYGKASTVQTDSYVEHRWNDDDDTRRCILFMGEPEWPFSVLDDLPVLRRIYDGCIAGVLIGDSIRLATLVRREIYGLYSIDQLRRQPEVRRALQLDPDVHYFMDAANVWFYGEKDGRMCVFDGETQELDVLGELAQAMGSILDQWDAV